MRAKQIVFKPIPPYFCCCEAGVPNALSPKIDGFVVVLLDEVPVVAVLPKADDPKGEDCGVVVVVATGVCPNENENAPDPEAGVPFAVVVVVVAAGVPVVLFTGNVNLGVVVVLLPVSALGALFVEVDIVEVPFPNTVLLGASEDLLPNTLPNTFGVWVCCIPKSEGPGLVPVLFEDDVVVFVLPPPNADFCP